MKSVVRLTDHSDMAVAVYHGRKTTRTTTILPYAIVTVAILNRSELELRSFYAIGNRYTL